MLYQIRNDNQGYNQGVLDVLPRKTKRANLLKGRDAKLRA